ncbi:MAG TPA: GTP-binding protein [Candidatus Nitrosocosmicus sp.]|nr:GTP-binding protein [Candidatus Nitrosocosmicus sp.]
MKNIRNFAIIAHIDHGKSTLADRLLELTHAVEGVHDEQMLDRNPISRERGITIKLAPVTMSYKVTNSKFEITDSEFILNLVDTPGHVDFSYEVERTLACVEGVILLVDATKGIQAQTIAHAYKAIEQDLVIIPVINKIDMPAADIEKTKKELVEFLGINPNEIMGISAKTGQNVKELLERVIEKIPAPKKSVILSEVEGSLADASSETSSEISRQARNDKESPNVKALIFDSYYDQYQGVIAFVRVFEGQIKKGTKIKLFATDIIFEVIEVGIFKPDLTKKETLDEGEIGYVVTNLKDIHEVQVGDTMLNSKSLDGALAGYKKVKPMVYASIFTTDPDEYVNLKKSLEKLTLNDSALVYEPIYSPALGSGFRVGFLGILHGDVVRERLEREFNLSLILTPPSVEYLPAENKDATGKQLYLEPVVEVNVVVPQDYVGAVMRLCEESRGTFLTMDNKAQVYLSYEMPLSELITNFFDKLKNITSGYASLDWHFKEYRPVVADKLLIMLNEDPVEEFSEFVVQERAQEKGQEIVGRLKELIPRQQYEVKIQAKYKGKIIAGDRISPFRKDVLMHGSKMVGGGDFSRKRKLLEKQKKGKKLMKSIGRVEIPKEAFLKLFKRES